MKGFRVLTLIFFAILYMGCQEEGVPGPSKQNILLDTLNHPPVKNLNYQVVESSSEPGGGVRLMWVKPDSAEPDDYVVSVDGVDLVPVTENYMDVYEPGAKLAVYARYGGVKSEPVTANFGAVETAEITVWSINDPSPDHPSGFGFTTDGTAATYLLSMEPEKVDFYISMGQSGNTPTLTAPKDHAPTPINGEGNASVIVPLSYDDLVFASLSDYGFFITQKPLYSDSVYCLWIDPTDNGFTGDDHFGKALVTNIEDNSGIYEVTFKLAYQKIPGLQWVVVDKPSSGIEE